MADLLAISCFTKAQADEFSVSYFTSAVAPVHVRR